MPLLPTLIRLFVKLFYMAEQVMVHTCYLPIFIQTWLSATFSQHILLSQVSRFKSNIPFIFWYHRYFQHLTHLTNTSMHSSRMCTARSPSMYCTGGSGKYLLLGGIWSSQGGQSAPRKGFCSGLGDWSWGSLLPGGGRGVLVLRGLLRWGVCYPSMH